MDSEHYLFGKVLSPLAKTTEHGLHKDGTEFERRCKGLKRIVVLFLVVALILTISTIATAMNVVQYIQMHQVSDGGYLDTPSVVSRYGNLTQTVYMQKLARAFGKEFVPFSYFEKYLVLLRDHSTYFEAPTWINYSVELSRYFLENGKRPDLKLLNAIDDFIAKNLSNYQDTPSYYQIISDGLTVSKMLKKNVEKTDIYKAALNVVKGAVDGRSYANAGLTVLAALIQNDIPFEKVKGLEKFVASNLSYLQGAYHTDFYLYKGGLLDLKTLQSIVQNVDIESPYQLYWYDYLCKMSGLKEKANMSYKNFESNRAPLGGYYELGNYSSVRDTYWATKALSLLGMETTKKYWMNFAENLVQTEYAYPVNVLSKYVYYAFDVNKEYHILSASQLKSLKRALQNKIELSPALTAYYLATFNFEGAFESLNSVLDSDYKGTTYYSDVNTTLGRLFNGLQKIDKKKRDLSYYYDYVQLLNFSHNFGYEVNTNLVKTVGEKFIQDIKKANYTDISLLTAAFKLQKNYGLTVDKNFYISEIKKLKDPATGGYFYNTLDGRLTFKSIYMANKLLNALEKQ